MSGTGGIKCAVIVILNRNSASRERLVDSRTCTLVVNVIGLHGEIDCRTMKRKKLFYARSIWLQFIPTAIAGKMVIGMALLSEKFFLILELMVRSERDTHADGAPKVFSNSPHVPVFPLTKSHVVRRRKTQESLPAKIGGAMRTS